MGSLEEAIQGAQTKPDIADDVINDLDIEEEEVNVENQEVYFFIIEKLFLDTFLLRGLKESYFGLLLSKFPWFLQRSCKSFYSPP